MRFFKSDHFLQINSMEKYHTNVCCPSRKMIYKKLSIGCYKFFEKKWEFRYEVSILSTSSTAILHSHLLVERDTKL